MANELNNFEDYIEPLNLGGMQGRMLRLPAPSRNKNSEILFVYGHHSSLERWRGLVEVLNRYSAVTVPDLPGFGGMDSLYSVGSKPTIDNLADYLATFVRWRYKRKKIVLVGLSFGFVVATRMLQNYPELQKKVKLVVSVVGFAHHSDFIFTRPRYLTYYWGTKICQHQPLPIVFRYVALNGPVLRQIYSRTYSAKHKFASAKDKAEAKAIGDIEVRLWQDNDPRTWMATTCEFLKFDNCQKTVDLPLWHVSVGGDRYFDEHRVEQHLRVIFSDFNAAKANLNMHAPSVIADAKTAAPMIPPKLRRVLREL